MSCNNELQLTHKSIIYSLTSILQVIEINIIINLELNKT